MKRIDVSLILPCYNEASLLDESVARILDVLNHSGLSFEIIFVDDKGQDNTAKLIATVVRKHSFCRAIYHTMNIGRGRTVSDGFRVAKGIVVGYIDIDLEVSPIYIPEMVRMILKKHADVVIGKRIYRTSLSFIPREIFSKGYQWLADAMIGTGGLDTETGYKFFNRKKVLPLMNKAKHPHWFWDTEIMVYARRGQLRIVEVPVLFLRRTDKKSSVRIFRDITDYLINLWAFRKRLNRL